MKDFTGFKRGIGVAGWLANYKRMGKIRPEWRYTITPGDRKHFASYFSEWDVTNIKHNFGADHIRFCFDQVVIEDYKTGAYIEEHLKYIDNFLDWCEKAGINVILNLMHAFGAYCDIPECTMFDDTALRKRFVKLWEMLEKRYGGRPGLVFDILNEPTLPLEESGKWNSLAAETIDAIRRLNKNRIIMIGGVQWNNAPALKDMAVFDDENVVYTFHFYSPHLFTHQRTFTSEPFHYSNHALSYPSGNKEYNECVKFLRSSEGNSEGAPVDEFPDVIDKEYLRAQMKPALDWMSAYPGKILHLGEFGVITNAEQASRENYMRDIISLCAEYGLPFCVWNYLSVPYDGNRFSLVDDYTRKPVSEKIVKAVKGEHWR